MDDTEPPLDSPGISPGSGHSRSLQLICHFDNKHENIRRLVYIHINKLCCSLSSVQFSVFLLLHTINRKKNTIYNNIGRINTIRN